MSDTEEPDDVVVRPYDDYSPEECRVEAAKQALVAMRWSAQPDLAPGRFGEVVTLPTASSYWRCATALLQGAGDITAEERALAWVLVEHQRWHGSLDELVTCVRTILAD